MLQSNSMEKPNFYLTTTLPYVNADPHIGFGLEITAADVIIRYKKQTGYNVIFNTGTDEHGQKIYEKALENNQTPQEYTDFWAAKFENLKTLLDIDYTHFIRTTDKHHVVAAQKFWEIVDNNGYIYKKMYKVKYCVGCELEKQDSELVNGKCPLHPTKELELREEENYFFKFSAFQDQLTKMYEDNPDFVKPPGKFNEIKSFVKGGLKDFSISRLKAKMPWGVKVPTDPDHVMYVWFDALVSYISTLGWPNTEGEYKDFWPGVQIAGKDNLRQQSAMWQAMLLAADLPPSKQILINGFVSIDGQKMSKSLGNVISPQEMVDRYGTDGTRFLLMFLGPIGSDMDTSMEKLDTAFTAHLSNGIGNLCSRVAKMCEKAELGGNKDEVTVSETVSKQLEQMNIKESLEEIIKQISEVDGYLSKEQPWTKSGDEQKVILNKSVTMIKQIATDLLPFMPKTAQSIVEHFSQGSVVALKPLFSRLNR